MWKTSLICWWLFHFLQLAAPHGRLFQPPGRSSAWRYGFSTPPNYNDHELYCGGLGTQWGMNRGKCGPCGDPYNQRKPRDNESGGKYGLGVIVNKYKREQKIEIGVELTANHRGFFEFRLCSHNAPKIPEDENCFKHLLQRTDGSGHRYYPGPGSKKFYVNYLLPKTLTCKQCVLQWRYVAGNNWGKCENGTGMVGCGHQEEFRSCADVQITDEDGSADETAAVVPEIPEDEEDYNDIDFSPQSHDAIPQHSYSGQIAAIVLSFLVVLIFLLVILLCHFWHKGTMKEILSKGKRPKWLAIPVSLMPDLMISSMKNKVVAKDSVPKSSSLSPNSPISIPPPVPPRRNRPSVSQNSTSAAVVETDSQERKMILSISSPMNVSINGVKIIPSPITEPEYIHGVTRTSS